MEKCLIQILITNYNQRTFSKVSQRVKSSFSAIFCKVPNGMTCKEGETRQLVYTNALQGSSCSVVITCTELLAPEAATAEPFGEKNNRV